MQQGDGANPQEIPPSFIPSGPRRRSQPTGPIIDSGSLNASNGRHAGAEEDEPAPITSNPPSFNPNARRRHAGRHAGAGQDEAAAAQASGAADAEQPASPRASRARHDESMPASFAPSRRSAERRSAADPAPRSAARSSGSSMRREGAGRPLDASAPRSFEPSRRPRRSSGSTAAAPNARPVPTARPSSALRSPGASRFPSRSGAKPAAGFRLASFHAPRLHAMSVRKGACIALAVFATVLLLAVFGAWTWVDSRLNKESGWLTTSANNSAESWLILGSDERDGTAGGSADDTPGFRTDTILVLTRPKHGASSLISIPRDSLTQVGGMYMKINAVAQIKGNKALVGEVEQITGQHIDHIAKIKFGGLKNVVDAIGGVELCYDQTVSDADSGLNWTAGCHVADGGTALAFSRMRYADANGDFGRAQRQRQVIAAIVKKASSSKVLSSPAKVMKIADAGLTALTVDNRTSPFTLVQMALAFKAATGSHGVTGSVYWTNPDYQVSGVGSSVLLDDSRNLELFSQLAAGSHKAGTVGTLAESGSSGSDS